MWQVWVCELKKDNISFIISKCLGDKWPKRWCNIVAETEQTGTTCWEDSKYKSFCKLALPIVFDRRLSYNMQWSPEKLSVIFPGASKQQLTDIRLYENCGTYNTSCRINSEESLISPVYSTCTWYEVGKTTDTSHTLRQIWNKWRQ